MGRKYLVNSFSFGEISPLLNGRIDSPYYRQACKTLKNAIPLATGPATKRPGTYYAANTKSNLPAVLVPWVLSENSGRVLEFTEDAVRVYKVGTAGTPEQITTAGNPVEINISAWSLDDDAGDLPLIKFVQDSTTSLYDTMLICFSNGRTALKEITRTDDYTWAAADVSYVGTTYQPTGNPTGILIFQDRLCLSYQNEISISKSNIHKDFGINSPPLPADAIQLYVYPDQAPEIVWLSGNESFMVGTPSGVWQVVGQGEILDGTAIHVATRQTGTGAVQVQPVVFEDDLVFVQKSGRKIHQMRFVNDAQKQVPTDLTFLAEHIADSKVIQMAYQREPEATLWVVTETGKLISMSYSRQVSVIGWAQHDLSGDVESVAVIPGETEDHVFVCVKRTIDGSTERHVEMLAPRGFDNLEDCHFVDAGILWDGGDSVDVTSITNAAPPICTATGHGIPDDSKVKFHDVEDLTVVNGMVFTTKNATTDTFELYTEDGTDPVDYSGEAAAGSGGTVKIVTNALSGLAHLEGEEVAVLGDGSVIASETVASGAVTLDEYANKIHAGLPFQMIVEPMEIAEGQGDVKRITKIWAKFYKSISAEIGPDVDNLSELIFLEGAPMMDDAPELTSGSVLENFPGDYNFEGAFVIASEAPQPLTVLSVQAEVEYPGG
jgi:hypothetical protein